VRREPRQQPLRFGACRRDVGTRNDALHAQDDIERCDRRTCDANVLAQATAQAIAIHGAAHRLAPDDVADAARRLRRRRGDQLQEVPVVPGTGLEYSLERADAAKAIARRARDIGRRFNDVKPKAVRGPSPAARTGPCARRRFSCVHESRACAHDEASMAERCVS
jgi:hypothetical protein